MMGAESIAEAPPRSRRGIGVAAIGGAVLLGRLLVPSGGAVPWLAGLYTVLLVASISAAPAGRRAATLPVAWALGIGLAAIGLAWALIGPPVRPAPGSAAVLLSALAAVAEEAFFRGFLYSRLEDGAGVGLAVVGSATAFALVHVPAYGLAAMPVDLAAGLLLSWQRRASRRWEVPAATHLAANLLAALR